jgi:hypothetical protein
MSEADLPHSPDASEEVTAREEPEAAEEAAMPEEPAAPEAPAAPEEPALPVANEENSHAAVLLQSAQRGKHARQSAEERKAARKAAEEAQALAATTTLQAAQRGAKSRKAQKQRQEANDLAAVKIQARYKGAKERRNPNAESNVRRERLKLDPQVQAEQYLERHQIVPLFEQLAQALIYSKPDDPKAFLVSKLQTLKGADDLSSPLLFFAADEVDALYDMYDVVNRGMTIAQCVEALKALGIDGMPVLPAGAKFVSKGEFKQLVNS